MFCEGKYIHIIELQDAHNNILETVRLKDEIDVITGMFTVAYVPVDGAINMNGFKEDGQFNPGMVSVKFSHCETTYSVPLFFECMQGFTSIEENKYNNNKQLLFRPLPIYKKIEPNTSIRIKYRDSLSAYRFKHNLKLLLTYKDK